MNRRPYDLPREEELSQRNEMEDHAHGGGVESDAAEEITGAGQRHEGVDQAHEIAPQRKTQPKQ